MVNPPTGGCIVEVTDSSLSIKWDPVVGIDTGKSYWVEVFYTYEDTPQTLTRFTEETSLSLVGDFTEPYTAKVRCKVGGAWSDFVSIDTLCATPPVINSIGWSPKGSFSRVAAGATYNGQHGTPFRVISVSNEQITATIGGGPSITYSRGGTFTLDDEGYTILHAIDDGECLSAVIGKNTSTNQHPTIGEEVQFSASIDWNDTGATATTRRMEWFYLKPPSESYTKAYADDINNWTHFATDTMPTHTFIDVGDVDVIYLKVIARNMANKTAEYGVGTCSAGQFNVWGGADGFEITVPVAIGPENLTIMTASHVPDTNTWLTGVIVLRWDNITNRVYFGTRDNLSCAYSDPSVSLCGTIPMQVGQKYAVFRSTSFISVVPGESVFTLNSGRTPVTADRSYLNFLESSICGFFGLSGSECTSFVAELVDAVYVANYASIMLTGKDTFGNERKLTWFDHVALPFALLGSLVPIPCAAIVRKGGYAVAKISDKVFSAPVALWTTTAMFDVSASSLSTLGEKIGFSRAIVHVGQSTAEEIVRLLDLDNMDAAYIMLRDALSKIDPDDASTFNSGFDWHEFNRMMKTKIDDPNVYAEYLRQSDLISGWADNIKVTASKANPTTVEKTAIANAAGEPAVMKVIGEDTTGALKTLNQVTDPAAKARRVKALDNLAKNLPAAFDDPAKASIHDVNGYLIKHDVIENVLGKSTCSANYELTTRLFKRLFDGVDEVALASSECDGLMAMAKEDPVAIAKAFDDYTTRTDRERLLLSLGKSGTAGQQAADWLASAKKNFDLSAVHQRFGTTVYDVVNDASQIPMHGPSGVYRTAAVDAINEAINSMPNFAHVEDMNKFVRETSSTVREHMIAKHYLSLISKANTKDKRGIADIFNSVGVDTIQSNLIADELWSVAHRLDVLGEVVEHDDLMTLTDRMVESNVVEGSVLFKQMVDRIVKNGSITTDELKSFFDVVNHNPVEVALAMESIPAGALASFNNVLASMGNKGKAIVTLMDMRNTIRAKFGAVGDTILNSWVRTTPVGLRLGRSPGDGFGSGVFKSLSVHSKLLEWAGSHWKALVAVLGLIGAAKFATYWFAFEWQPFHAVLRKAGVMDERTADKYTDAMYAAGEDMDGLDWNIDKLSVRESVYNTVGILCELADYAEKNPIPADKLPTIQETFNLYVGTSAGIVGNSLYVDIQKDLRQLLMKYNERFLECIGDGKCTIGDECVTGTMVYDQRKISDDKLADDAAYQTIIDNAWECIPGYIGLGTIRCTSNQAGFAVYLDGDYINHSYGNTWLVIPDVAIGPHTVKIEKGEGYTPRYCEDTVLVIDGEIADFDCQMVKTGVSGGTIKCTSNQTGFAVYLDGNYVDHSYGNTYLVISTVPPGTHTVKIEKGEGYTPRYCEDGVLVIEGVITDFDCQMAKVAEAGGTIKCTSNQTGFAVYVDGAYIDHSYGNTYLLVPNITAGQHTVKIEKGTEYTPTHCEDTVTVVDGGIVDFDCQMVKEEPPVESTSLTIERMIDKSGNDIPRYWEVEIWVDGKYTKCQGPQTMTFGTGEFCDCEHPWYLVPCELGTHTIALKKSGYEILSKTFALVKDVPQTWESPVMEIQLSLIYLRSNQTGFDGYMDGVHIGNSGNSDRLTVYDLVYGTTYKFKISKGAGYSPEYCEKNILIERSNEFHCEMYPVTTHDIDLVIPAGATVYVDGKPLTGTTTVGRLTAILNELRKR